MASDSVELQGFQSSPPLQEVYPPAISAEAYPPPTMSPTVPPPLVQPNHIQLSTSDIEVRVEEPEYIGAFYRKLIIPESDPLSVVAPTKLNYSVVLRADVCTSLLLPHLVDGHYRVDLPANHAIAAFTTQQDLQSICDYCTSEINGTRRQVSFYTGEYAKKTISTHTTGGSCTHYHRRHLPTSGKLRICMDTTASRGHCDRNRLYTSAVLVPGD